MGSGYSEFNDEKWSASCRKQKDKKLEIVSDIKESEIVRSIGKLLIVVLKDYDNNEKNLP